MAIFDFFAGGTEQDRFARMVIRELKQRGIPDTFSYNKERFELVSGDQRLSLLAIFQEWRATPAALRAEQRKRIVGSFIDEGPEDSFEACAPFLFPTINNRLWLKNQTLLGLVDFDWEPALTSLAGELVVMPAIDRPLSMSFVGPRQLENWGRTREEVLEVAIQNMKARSSKPFQRNMIGYWRADFGDHYDAARLLLPELFEAFDLKGDPVAIAASRSMLLVADSENEQALWAMAKDVGEARTREPRPISAAPLILREKQWAPLDIDEIPSLRRQRQFPPELGRLRVNQLRHDAMEQKQALESYFQKIGRRVHVANLIAVDRDEHFGTLTAWDCFRPCLLPKADSIVLTGSPRREEIVRRWDEVEAICGPWTAEPETSPPRYLLEEGPTEEQWKRLNALDLPSWMPGVRKV